VIKAPASESTFAVVPFAFSPNSTPKKSDVLVLGDQPTTNTHYFQKFTTTFDSPSGTLVMTRERKLATGLHAHSNVVHTFKITASSVSVLLRLQRPLGPKYLSPQSANSKHLFCPSPSPPPRELPTIRTSSNMSTVHMSWPSVLVAAHPSEFAHLGYE
jgi:hypothetical protein